MRPAISVEACRSRSTPPLIWRSPGTGPGSMKQAAAIRADGTAPRVRSRQGPYLSHVRVPPDRCTGTWRSLSKLVAPGRERTPTPAIRAGRSAASGSVSGTLRVLIGCLTARLGPPPGVQPHVTSTHRVAHARRQGNLQGKAETCSNANFCVLTCAEGRSGQAHRRSFGARVRPFAGAAAYLAYGTGERRDLPRTRPGGAHEGVPAPASGSRTGAHWKATSAPPCCVPRSRW